MLEFLQLLNEEVKINRIGRVQIVLVRMSQGVLFGRQGLVKGVLKARQTEPTVTIASIELCYHWEQHNPRQVKRFDDFNRQ